MFYGQWSNVKMSQIFHHNRSYSKTAAQRPIQCPLLSESCLKHSSTFKLQTSFAAICKYWFKPGSIYSQPSKLNTRIITIRHIGRRGSCTSSFSSFRRQCITSNLVIGSIRYVTDMTRFSVCNIVLTASFLQPTKQRRTALLQDPNQQIPEALALLIVNAGFKREEQGKSLNVLQDHLTALDKPLNVPNIPLPANPSFSKIDRDMEIQGTICMQQCQSIILQPQVRFLLLTQP